MAETRERADVAEEAAESERRLARYAAFGIPALSIVVAIAVGMTFSIGPAILVLVGGTLLGTISLLWASIRTLSGDAPLPTDWETMVFRTGAVDDLSERKRRVLRALKDLELEHSVGKIDDKDYASLGDKFRAEAKQILRDLDERVDPLRDEAERVAQRYLEKKGLGGDGAAKKKPAKRDEDDGVEGEAPKAPSKPEKSAAPRLACPKCETSNEPDAAFCKKCGASLAATKTEETADASS